MCQSIDKGDIMIRCVPICSVTRFGRSPARQGFVLLMVVGLISLLLALAVGLALKVKHQTQQVGTIRLAASKYLAGEALP